MAEASDLKFGTQLGFAKAHDKITPIEKKWAWPWYHNRHPYVQQSD